MMCNMYADAIRLCTYLMPQSSAKRRAAASPQMEIFLPVLDESIHTTTRNTALWLMQKLETFHEGRNRHPIATQPNWQEQRLYSLAMIGEDFKALETQTSLAREAFIQAATYNNPLFRDTDLAHAQYTELCANTATHLRAVHTLLRHHSILGVSAPTPQQQHIIQTAFTTIQGKLESDSDAFANSGDADASLAVKIMHGLLTTKISKSLNVTHKLMHPSAEQERAPLLLAGAALNALRIYQPPEQLKEGLPLCDTAEQMLCHEVITIMRTLKNHVERDHYRDLVQNAASDISKDIASMPASQREQSYDHAKQTLTHSMDGALALLEDQVNSLSHLTEHGHRYFNSPSRHQPTPNPSRYLS